MKRTTRWMIVGVYNISQVLGVFAFSYDCETGKLKTKPFITIYCGFMSILTFGAIPLMFRIEWKSKNSNGPALHVQINSLMYLIKIVAVLITVILNWSRRKTFLKTFNDFQRLRLEFLQKYQISEKVAKYFENSIRSKFYWGFAGNVILFIGSFDILRNIFHLESSILVVALGILVTFLNFVITHYYFGIMNVNALLAVVNEEVQRNLNSSSVLFKRHRLRQIKPGAFITQCCQLADTLDDLAVAHYNLQHIAVRINHMYDFQGACVMLTIYLTNISVIYMSYKSLHREELTAEYGEWVMLFIFIAVIFYYADLKTFLWGLLDLLYFVEKTGKLLKSRQPWLPTLDARLEKSLKNFSLQIAAFPFEMKLVGLYNFCRPIVFATLGSTISNAILLMQYDYAVNKIS